MDSVMSDGQPPDAVQGPVAPLKILIVKLSAVGDVVMSLPALWALRRKYPQARIDWLVEAGPAELLVGHPALDRVLISPRHQLKRLVKSGHWLAARRLARDFRRDLRAVEYDVVLDLQGLFKSGFQVWLARGARKVGFDRVRERAHWFLNEKMPAYDPERHAARRYLDAAVYLGADRPDPEPEKYYTPPPRGEVEAARLLAGLAGPWVVLNPGARWVAKHWPVGHWQQLAARLAGEKGLSLVVTGGPADVPLGRAIAEAAPGAVRDLCGRTSLSGLAAILARAEAVVTGDTGPMHLAAAVGARGLALFGPTRPNRTGPFGGRFHVLTPPRNCLGCLKKKCGRSCLADLAPETVQAHLQTLLEEGE